MQLFPLFSNGKKFINGCFLRQHDKSLCRHTTLSLSKGRAERPLPAMVRQAHHDSPLYNSIREILSPGQDKTIPCFYWLIPVK
jgi:hypothetical protein